MENNPINFQEFKEQIQFVLCTLHNGYSDMNEFRKDFMMVFNLAKKNIENGEKFITAYREDNFFDPEVKARAFGYPTLRELLESDEMEEFVKIEKDITKYGDTPNVIYKGKHIDGCSSIFEAMKISAEEKQKKLEQRKQYWREKNRLNEMCKEKRMPPASPPSAVRINPPQNQNEIASQNASIINQKSSSAGAKILASLISHILSQKFASNNTRYYWQENQQQQSQQSSSSIFHRRSAVLSFNNGGGNGNKNSSKTHLVRFGHNFVLGSSNHRNRCALCPKIEGEPLPDWEEVDKKAATGEEEFDYMKLMEDQYSQSFAEGINPPMADADPNSNGWVAAFPTAARATLTPNYLMQNRGSLATLSPDEWLVAATGFNAQQPPTTTLIRVDNAAQFAPPSTTQQQKHEIDSHTADPNTHLSLPPSRVRVTISAASIRRFC